MTTKVLIADRRPSLHEDMSAFFTRVEAMFPADSPWYVDADYACLAKGTGEEFAVDSFWKRREYKIKGQFTVWVREEGFMDDRARASDRIIYEFPSSSVETVRPCEAARQLISVFGAYEIACYDDDLYDLQSGRQLTQIVSTAISRGDLTDYGGRDSVWMLMPLNYWDAEKCRRSFGVSVEKLVARLAPHVYKAEIFEGGAWVQLDESLDTHLNREQTVALFKRAKVKPTA